MKNQILEILMIEDNPDHAILAKQCLERTTANSVKIVCSYVECCKALKTTTFDIILVDYHLPDEDGLTILKRLINQEKIEIPIVVVTGHGHEKLAVEAMKSGAFDYVMKTNDYPTVLPGVVKNVFEKYQIVQEKKRMENEIVIRNRELHVLNSISEVINNSLNLNEILNGAVVKINQLLGLTFCAVYISDASSQNLILKAHKGPNNFNKQLNSTRVNISEIVKREMKPLLLNDLPGSKFDCNNKPFVLVAPLTHGKKYLGVLIVGSENKDIFTGRYICLINSICNQLSMAIENANLYLELNNTKVKLENVLNSSLDLIVTMGQDGALKFYNERFARNYQLVNGKTNGFNFFEYIPEEKKDFFQMKLEQLKSEKSAIYEIELRQTNGSFIPCIISQSRMKGNDDFLLVIKDISKIINLQKQLMQSEKLSALGKMIAGVAHELNNPLAGILGFSQLLLEDNVSEQVRSDIKAIYKEASRCQKIVKNLLAFARKQKPERQSLSINEVLDNILDIQFYQFKLDSVTLIKKFGSDLPKITGDYSQLQQVFLNLINNAIFAVKASGKDEKQITISTCKYKNRVRVQIADNGVGISPEVKQRIFDPFFTTREVGQGTGLGLSICFGIVESHHGNIVVESKPGLGSTFTVDFSILEDEVVSYSN